MRTSFGLSLMLLCVALASRGAVAQALPELPTMPAASTTADAAPRPWGLQAQWSLLGYTDRLFGTADLPQARTQAQRLALDLRRDDSLRGGWRYGLSARLERVWVIDADPGAPDRAGALGSLREAWVSHALRDAGSTGFVDLGRINWRLGAGSGYNPGDFFKTRAVRSSTSQDPGSLRLERLGVFMLRGQWLGEQGAWTLALAPRLTARHSDDDGAYSLAVERTNGHAAGLLRWAPRLAERVSLDLQLFRREGERVQLGANATWLASDALVFHTEVAFGRRPALAGPAATSAASSPLWRARAAVGGTLTLPAGIELTLEWQHTGDALSRSDWDEWRRATDAATQIRLGALARERVAQQEPLVRANAFFRAAWRQPFGVADLDLSAFVQLNTFDHSRTWQLRASQGLGGRWALSAQVGALQGAPDTEYGSSSLKRYGSLQLSCAF
ncbi:MAG: hypothetical protein ING89_13440 [Rubrivivax sp.]|nr:hypothetical protein [Rubrivivax sp.]